MRKPCLLIIPLMAVSLLANCNGGKEPPSPPLETTYTITIKETQHFVPSGVSFTFKENDFSPIVIPYEIVDSFVVTKVTADIEETLCIFDSSQKKLIVTPQTNSNIVITVSVTHLTQVSYVTIINPPAQFTPKINNIPFERGHYAPIRIPYIVDDLCTINDPVVTSGTATCQVTSENIIVTPEADDDVLLTVTVNEEFKAIHFHVDHGSLGEEAKEEIKIPFGGKWGDYVDATAQIAVHEGNRVFKGWSFGRLVTDEIIDDSYVVNLDSPKDVYAIFIHKIDLNSRSLKLDRLVYDTGPLFYLHLYFKFMNIEQYDIPKADDFHVTIDGNSTPLNFIYECIESSGVIHITITKEWRDINDDIIHVFIDEFAPTYEISYELDHLTDGVVSTEVKKGVDFVFTLTADSPQNTTIYSVPYDINITVDDSPIFGSKAYSIKDISEEQDLSKAEVTIFGRFVKGAIKVIAKAAINNIYRCFANGYNLTCTLSSDSEEVPYEEEEIITFSGEAASKVALHNILVRIDDNNWYTCEALPAPYIDYIEFHMADCKIVIKENADCIKQSITFYIFDPDYSIFNNADWETIDLFSSLPTEQIRKIFVVGELRKVESEGYSFRIIGISHDSISGTDKKAGLTIEFQEIISKVDEPGSPHLIHFSDDTKHGYYPDGPLSHFLRDELPWRLPEAMRNVMKTVSKKSYYVDEDDPGMTSFDTKMFELATDEYLKDDTHQEKEGSIYEYYKDGDPNKRKKYLVSDPGHTTSYCYWTRTGHHNIDFADRAKFINENGEMSFGSKNFDRAFSPAFCV